MSDETVVQETTLTPEQKSMQAIESCFSIIANASHRIDKMEEVKSCLSFLDSLHGQLKAQSEAPKDE